MKLALFLILCLVSLSYQQYFFPAQQRSYFQHDPRLAFFYYPLNTQLTIDAGDVSESNNGLDGLSSIFSSSGSGLTFDGSDLFHDAQARVPVSGLNYQNPKSRFIFGQFLSQLSNNNLFNGPVTTLTSTVLSTTTSTVSVASVINCISIAGFSSIDGGVTSTAACSRKRRGIVIDETEGLVEAVEPSQVEPLEASMAANFRDSRGLIDYRQPEIVSSQELPGEEKTIAVNNRQKRAVVIVTVPSTVTAYSFSNYNITRKFSLAAANALTCLPAGFTVC